MPVKKNQTRVISTPLFWDLHLHGAAGIDFMHAKTDAMVHSCQQLGKHGIGFFAPTLLTSELPLLKEACKRWGAFCLKAKQKGFLKPGSALPIGLHLEGPFLNPKMAGAHPQRHLYKPSTSLTQTLLQLSQNQIRIMTLAPELKGATALIRQLSRAKIRVQIGHTMATSHEVSRAIQAGAEGVTHLYNAMKIHHREPSVLGALRKGLLTSEIITDGVHLHPEFVYWCWKLAPHNLYAVSDGCCVMGEKKSSHHSFTLGSLRVERKGSVAVVKGSDILAGGATYLSEHPHRLQKELSPEVLFKMLPMFYKLQQSLFPDQKNFFKKKQNHFERKTFRFLESK